jgi:RNA polymerase sigma-70 factor (ECF subfamily)
MSDAVNISTTLETHYRKDSGNLVSVLTRIFGPANMEMAEDVVQDAMVEAMKHWKENGIPDNPSAWLMRTAKNKALNIIKRDKYKLEYAKNNLYLLESGWTAEAAIEEMFSDAEIKDDLLRMMFVCCNPELGKEAQTSLILKTLCGFSISEIAKAYLTTETTITKRLVRARQTIRDLNIAFEIPPNENLTQRVESVLETIYLLFNEGYSATEGDEHIRMDICAEAIRLCRILSEHSSGKNSATFSLLALMCFNASRFRARISKEGDIILLHEQDRSLWNRPLIQSGANYLQKAAGEGVINSYYIQAAISACHCIANNYEQTNWQEILNLYNLLIRIDHSPVVQLNRIVALSKVHGQQAALNELDTITKSDSLDNYYLYHAVKGELQMELLQWPEACNSFEKAATLTMNNSELKTISKKIETCRLKLN